MQTNLCPGARGCDSTSPCLKAWRVSSALPGATASSARGCCQDVFQFATYSSILFSLSDSSSNQGQVIRGPSIKSGAVN
eukprot:210458-Hanusia_phi.AAC.1